MMNGIGKMTCIEFMRGCS